MPNIRTYTAPNTGLDPDNRAAIAFAYAGRNIGNNYESLGRSIGGTISKLGGEYAQHEARKEITRGAAGLTELQDLLGQDWTGKANNTDPHDDTIVDDFRDNTLEPALQGWVDSFDTEEGKRWAEQQVATTRQRFFERTSADQARRAGAAVVADMDVLQNRASNLVMRDPGSLNTTLGLIDSSLQGLVDNTPGLSVEQATRMRTELAQEMKSSTVKSAIIGMVEQDPEAARTALATEDFSDYLTADDVGQLDRYAQSVTRQREEQERMNLAEQRRVQSEQFNAASSALSASLYREDGTLQLPSDFYANFRALSALPGADDGTVRAIASMARTATEDAARGRPVVDDATVYAGFSSRMMLPAGHPNALTELEIYQAQANRLLSPQSATMFRGAVSTTGGGMSQDERDLRSQVDDLKNSFKSSITSSNVLSGFLDGPGDQRYGQMSFAIDTAVTNALASGMQPGEIRQRLLNPNSPDYLGRLAINYAFSPREADTYLNQFIEGVPTLVPAPGAAPVPGAPAAPGAAPASAPRPTRDQFGSVSEYTAAIQRWREAGGQDVQQVVNQAEVLRRAEQEKAVADRAAARESERIRMQQAPRVPLRPGSQ